MACRCAEIQVMMDQGRHVDATDSLRRLRHPDPDGFLPEMLRRKVDRLEISCRLALKDFAFASLICNSSPATRRAANVVARLDLSAGRPDLALARLTAGGHEDQGLRASIERLVLLARAQLQLGNRRQAEHTLRRAIEQARAERYVRVFVDDGLSLLPLLHAIAGPYPDAYLTELVDHVERAWASSEGPHFAPMLEPLTERERELLGCLPTHLSLREIAATKCLSHNTIKTHVGTLYRKLGVGSRSQAVQTARLHGLL
jgi:DNA-binding CsgD family transcriptional regulator